MTQQSFVKYRESFWNEFETLVKGSKRDRTTNARGFPRRYRELTQDLNTARAHGFDPSLIERLNSLVQEGNQILYSQRSWSLKAFAAFLLNDFPLALRSQWRSLLAAVLLFYGVAAFFAALCLRYPEMVRQIAAPDTVHSIERMYDPESPHFLKPREVRHDADMFGYYIYNNISIAFRTFAAGILFGVGSIFILMFNGVFLGTVAAHMLNSGFGETFFPFVIAHSSFELTAIVLSAQAGLLLGFRFFVTKGLTRSASLKCAGLTALPIIAGAALMLVIAAAIEAFWSSRHELPLELRYAVGAALWLLVLGYVTFAGRFSSSKGKRVQ